MTPTSTRDAIGGGATTTLFDCDAPGVDRFHFEGFVSDADLNDYYLPVFSRPLSRARPAAIMCSFASLNGVPSCANGLMQNTLARQSWGFEGRIKNNWCCCCPCLFTIASSANPICSCRLHRD